MDSPILIHLPREEWTKENVTRFIMQCIDSDGIPMFKTRYARAPFRVDGKRAVMAICYGGKEEGVFGPYSRVFVNVPEEDLKLIREKVGEWIALLEKYAPDQVERAIKKLGEVI